MRILPTGTQYEIRAGHTTAVVGEVGATLRSFRVRDREILATYSDDEPFSPWRGTTLTPWPNRIRDGRYVFDGVEYRLPINEHERNCALHGLGHAVEWRLLHRQPDSVSLATVIYPQPGWAGCLRMEITYSVRGDALSVEHEASNVGEITVPYGYGAHPYFAFDDLAKVSLSLPFQKQLLVDNRLLPKRIDELETQFDFRAPHKIGDVSFDTAFTEGPKDWEIRLAAPSHTVTVWADQHHPWAQLHSPEDRTSLAVEPMTCGPDAFNDGPTRGDLVQLAPGQSFAGRWGVRVR
ncbi:aldose 1-epimerase family protein [Tessaracoccus sp. OH4464_COT-324]|uniref:aldose 1-epimerase family protein n=1 Tax=Tessaracoccus sp. OH4464_COT-324 TaxID=2491059 RepID=UPI000F631150|nr:aldose 1-epimerase family protein [Tessaracoccus sp. OH4464_COT-324]RRD47486.1 aldose epimerase [Tessaracoccus sp. OH4464_COT-324]